MRDNKCNKSADPLCRAALETQPSPSTNSNTQCNSKFDHVTFTVKGLKIKKKKGVVFRMAPTPEPIDLNFVKTHEGIWQQECFTLIVLQLP